MIATPSTTVQNFAGTVRTLPNGLTLILRSIPTAAAVTCDLWVRTGARTEPEALAGVSHFLEHMIFKGTEKLGPGVFDSQIENRGGVTNAATSQDYTHYYITVANEHFEAALPYLVELVNRAAIPPDEYERERLVVLEEIRRSHDSPDRRAFEILARTMYPDHPYGRPVLGTAESLLAMSADQMRAYHRERYQPANTVAVIVGGVSEERMLAACEAEFADLAGQPIPASVEQPPALVPPGIHTHTLARLEQPRLLLAWQGAPIADIEEAIGLDVLATILAEGRTSRLVRSLREEKGWVRSIQAYFMPQKQPGLFVIAAQADHQRLEAVEAEVRGQLAQLIDEPVSDDELGRAVRILRNDFVFNTEAPAQLAGLYGYYSTVATLETALDYPAYLQKVRPTDLQRIARHYIDPQKAVVLRLLPESL
ncbi:M16 family metallopeptidase [Gloeobacter kilaueensis]|uniref:Peptidase M16 domain protein n=1 Tax=Gloeobacter kilaueensis (strain ATCC BAA-2537 / CCAP 1431/1 / ULC 316 / JS1) TaxID=1183438 RepID=U5QKI3_GLOK1|nr:pitrilysin family protein [Gloeobacter kilaueensis]AGY59487.1 peptidase M16 domain protein [Gloeobacter kilaueensis JS1]